VAPLHPFKLSPSRIVGTSGVVLSLIIGTLIAGGNPTFFWVLSEWTVVLGMTFFGLLAAFGTNFLGFSVESIKALVSHRPPNEYYAEIARQGPSYAVGSGVAAFIMGITITCAYIDGPTTEVGAHVAASMTGLVLGSGLALILFPFLASTFGEKKQNPQVVHPWKCAGILLAVFLTGVSTLVMTMWMIHYVKHSAPWVDRSAQELSQPSDRQLKDGDGE
jgi:flagellar motor component MotA